MGDRIYNLKIFCDESYPDSPPEISFVTKINMSCVNQTTGLVGKIPGWNRDCSIATCLCYLREQMKRASKSTQPPDGTEF